MIRSILITGCGGPAGVNVIRAFRLTDPSLKLYGIDNNALHLAFVQGLVDKAFFAPMKHGNEYIDFLNRIIKQYNIDLVIPQPDPEVEFLSEFRSEIQTNMFLPSAETIRICQDKHKTAQIWKEKGLKVVDSWKVRSRIKDIYNDIEDAVKKFGGFPVWLRATKGAGGRASTKITSVDHGYHWCYYWLERNPDIEFIVQPYLNGRNYAVSTLWINGTCIISQARERIEYIYPNLAPSGVTGTPAIARTVSIPKLECVAIESILAIDKNPHGLYSVDLMGINDDFVPTEINAGRFFTTSLFFTTAAILYKQPHFNFHRAIIDSYIDENQRMQEIGEYLPENIYWIRHIDCGERLFTQDEVNKLYGEI